MVERPDKQREFKQRADHMVASVLATMLGFIGFLWFVTNVRVRANGYVIPLLLLGIVCLGAVLRQSRGFTKSLQENPRGYAAPPSSLLYATGVEILAIAAVIVICQSANHSELSIAAIAATFGVYVLILSWILKIPALFSMGAVLTIAAITIMLLSMQEVLSAQTIHVWAGQWTAIIGWGFGLALAIRSR